MTMTYPLVLFLYKRPQNTLKILNKAVKANIKKIYAFIDGPKQSTDLDLINQTKKIINEFTKTHPSMNVVVFSAKKNLGLQHSIVLGLNKVFQKETAAIILEDDCLPSPDFFQFTSEILTKYKNHPKVMSVTGSGVGKHSSYSYDFSRYQQCWGFGTWRRSWKLYDSKLTKLTPLNWKNYYMRHYFNTMLFLTKAGQVNSWAFKWSFAHFINDGLAIIPTGNLIRNIGFDSVATNTRTNSPLFSIKITKMKFPLKHPKQVKENLKLSKKIEKLYYKNIIGFLGMLRQFIIHNYKKICA